MGGKAHFLENWGRMEKAEFRFRTILDVVVEFLFCQYGFVKHGINILLSFLSMLHIFLRPDKYTEGAKKCVLIRLIKCLILKS